MVKNPTEQLQAAQEMANKIKEMKFDSDGGKMKQGLLLLGLVKANKDEPDEVALITCFHGSVFALETSLLNAAKADERVREAIKMVYEELDLDDEDESHPLDFLLNRKKSDLLDSLTAEKQSLNDRIKQKPQKGETITDYFFRTCTKPGTSRLHNESIQDYVKRVNAAGPLTSVLLSLVNMMPADYVMVK